MTTFTSYPSIMEEEFYPTHPEDDVPENDLHERQNAYLRAALRAHLRGSYVTGNVCIYWEPGNTSDYAAPDVFVIPGWKPETRLRVYRLWAFPPIAFVAEVFSATDTTTKREEKEIKYAQKVRAPEYLSYDEERRQLTLRLLGPNGYEEIPPVAPGRVRSEQLQVEFGYDETGFLWIYTPEGERLPCYEELDERAADAAEQKQHAEARATEEARQRQEAEARAAEEARQREQAEARATEEARQRQEAEARATAEARQREEAEARTREAELRAQELERQLAELQARLSAPGD